MSMLDEDELDARRQSLVKLRGELTALVTGATEGARPVDLDEPIGRISRVDAMQQQKMLAANRQAAQQRRRQVEAALDRIEAGEYGECQGCGEDVEPRRLEAQPEAPLCLDCQSRREKRDRRLSSRP
jgi:DnaK suppressor protein